MSRRGGGRMIDAPTTPTPPRPLPGQMRGIGLEELSRRPLQERVREAVRRVSGVGVGPYTTEGVRRVLEGPEGERKALDFPVSPR